MKDIIKFLEWIIDNPPECPNDYVELRARARKLLIALT